LREELARDVDVDRAIEHEREVVASLASTKTFPPALTATGFGAVSPCRMMIVESRRSSAVSASAVGTGCPRRSTGCARRTSAGTSP